jgi:hypothetical protein
MADNLTSEAHSTNITWKHNYAAIPAVPVKQHCLQHREKEHKTRN